MRTSCCVWGTTGLLGLLLACASQPAQPSSQPSAEHAQPSAEPAAGSETPEASSEAVTPEELCKRLQELHGKDVNDTSRCVEELESRRLQDDGVYDAYAVCVIAAESTEVADACEQ
ncbi:MAG: hypothetical protein ACPG4T_00990 [Nannocystaceae bacterium]